MEWFRMYSEFASDPKVQSMNEAMQRRLMMLLCLRCSNTLVTLHDDEIAFALRITEQELQETKILFERKGFVTGDWEINNWDKRQFVSDSSAARVAKHRAKKNEVEKRAGNNSETQCNVTVTPQIQNRTDTEQIQNINNIPPQAAIVPKPKKYEFAKELIDLGVESKVVDAWMQVRKAKKATNSEIALIALKREAAKAGLSIADAVRLCVEKSWSGLDADWLKPKSQASPMPQKGLEHLGKHGQATATAAQQWLEESNAG